MSQIPETDGEEKYADLLISEAGGWRIYLHEDQHYLGRCYIWSTRQGHIHLGDTTIEDWLELRVQFRKLENAIRSLWKPDRFNHAVLGNLSARVHMHVIPRYRLPREALGITFVDGRWNQNCFPSDRLSLSRSQLHHLRDRIKSCI